MRNQDIDLVLSTDAKPRLKWTAELHRRFIDAVAQLGGAEKATPKSLMRVMCIPGLTLYHLKSHLQKYRLGKNHQQSETSNGNGHDEEIDYREFEMIGGDEIMGKTDTQINDTLHIGQALQVQMEVQKKLHEQIEVQRHLQMRIEAQGMYLQSILKKAQDALVGYSSSSSVELEALNRTQNQSSPLSGLTETASFSFVPAAAGNNSMRGSMDDSSLTSSESSGHKDHHEKLVKDKEMENTNTHDEGNRVCKSYRIAGRKRSRRSNTCVEQPPSSKKSVVVAAAAAAASFHQVKQWENSSYGSSLKELDLNCKYEVESGGLQDLDLNCEVNL